MISLCSKIIRSENITNCKPILLEDEQFGEVSYDRSLSGITYVMPEGSLDLASPFFHQNTEETQDEIEKQKELIILEAKKEAEKIILESQEKATQILKDAEDSAILFKSDIEAQVIELLTKANEEKEYVIENANIEKERLIAEGVAEKKHIILEAEEEIVNIVNIAISEIISSEICYPQDWLSLIVRKIIREDNISDYHVKVGSSVINALNEEDIALYNIVLDDSLKEGQCILVCEYGQIEYDMSIGLKRIIKQIKTLLKNS